MPSTNKTPHLGLNQWLETDKPKRDDFCQDNLKIDAKFQQHCDDAGKHPSFIIGTYVGNGSVSRNIALDFTPKLLFVYCVDHAPVEIPSGNQVSVYSGCCTAHGGTAGLSLGSNRFSVIQAGSSMAGYPSPSLNQNNGNYVYIALR